MEKQPPATKPAIEDRVFSRRQFLTYEALMQHEGMPVGDAVEAVSEWAKDHPDVDMDEEMTWAEWHAQSDTDSD